MVASIMSAEPPPGKKGHLRRRILLAGGEASLRHHL